MATTTMAVFVLLGVHFFVVAAGYVLLLAAMVSAAGVLMAAGYMALQRGRVRSAVARLAVANYAIALGATTVAPFAMPVLLIATMLPAVLAVPYVTRRALRTYVSASFLVALGVAVLGAVQDVTGLREQLPGWIPPAVVIVFTPCLAVMVALVALTNATVLDDAHQLEVRTNQRLVQTRTTLSENVKALQASRARAVAAADRERQRIERNLHDGAQQALLGAAVQLAAVRDQARQIDPRIAVDLESARDALQHAIEQLRDLAHGICPVNLTEGGLAPALQHALARSPGDISARLGVAQRYDPAVESAVYFCCVEALHNALKHGGDRTHITVSLEADESELRFEVSDDGRGFDPALPTAGTGFDNMADRLGAIAGRLEIVSSIGSGTRVSAVVPAEPVGSSGGDGGLPMRHRGHPAAHCR